MGGVGGDEKIFPFFVKIKGWNFSKSFPTPKKFLLQFIIVQEKCSVFYLIISKGTLQSCAAAYGKNENFLEKKS